MFQIPQQKPLEPSAPLPALHAAARAGDLDALTPLLQERVTLDAPDADGRTALHWASAEGHEAIAHALLNGGAKIDTPNPRGETALSFAVTYGQAPVVRLLLDAGASCNIYRSPEAAEKEPPPPEAQRFQEEMEERSRRFDIGMQKRIDRSMTAEAAAKWRAERETENRISDAKYNAWRTQPLRIDLLSRAVRVGSLEILTALLEAGESPNYPNPLTSLTLLGFALSIGSPGMIPALLKHGADPNANNPLFQVVASGNLERARLLLEAGADPNRKADTTEYPVLMALITGNAAMLDLLMEFGARLDTPDEKRTSYSAFLKKKPALREAVRRRQGTTWMESVENGSLDDVRTALDGRVNLNALRDDDQTALLLAVKQGEIDVVRLLLERGAGPNVSGKSGITPLHDAVATGSLEMVRLLLEAGADPNQTTTQGWTPLQWASQKSEDTIADLLEVTGATVYPVDLALRGDAVRLQQVWEAGTPIDTPNPANMTALMGAILKGNQSLVTDLVARGANINARDSSGDTSLHHAIRRDDATIFEYLLRQGADPAVKGKTGHSLLYDALLSGRLETARLLLKAGARIDYEGAPLRQHLMHDALLFDQARDQVGKTADASVSPLPPAPERLRLLLDFGGDINAISRDGETLLTAAIEQNAAAAIALLLERDADINQPNDGEETPLIVALKARNTDIAKTLIEKGADINYDWQGLLPLDIAERTLPDITRWLRQHGAQNSQAVEDGSYAAEMRQMHLDMLTDDTSVEGLIEKTSSLFSRQE